MTDQEFKLDPENMPETLADLFAGFNPKGKKAEAIMRLGTAWDQMTADQRKKFFPESAISDEIASLSWQKVRQEQRAMPIYQQSFVQVFGDHKTPFDLD